MSSHRGHDHVIHPKLDSAIDKRFMIPAAQNIIFKVSRNMVSNGSEAITTGIAGIKATPISASRWTDINRNNANVVDITHHTIEIGRCGEIRDGQYIFIQAVGPMEPLFSNCSPRARANAP